nr:MAG TPA: hypothetical protein [Caudoviricetes sp.]
MVVLWNALLVFSNQNANMLSLNISVINTEVMLHAVNKIVMNLEITYLNVKINKGKKRIETSQ